MLTHDLPLAVVDLAVIVLVRSLHKFQEVINDVRFDLLHVEYKNVQITPTCALLRSLQWHKRFPGGRHSRGGENRLQLPEDVVKFIIQVWERSCLTFLCT